MASLLKIAFCIGFFVLALVPLLVILERRISAFMQGRIGPNRVNLPLLNRLGGVLPGGLAQPLADAIKLLFKEDLTPAGADKFLYLCGPLFVLVPPALGMIVIPFGSRIGQEQLQVADLGVGVLFTMSVLSVAVYGLAFGGWASNNKYSLMGGLRASAQLISYELTLGLSIMMVLMMSAAHPSVEYGSVNPLDIVGNQVKHGWNLWGGGNLLLLPAGVIGFILFFIAALAENNRLPFDLPECEAELVGGYHTEYSGMKFSMFMMGEYVAMVLMSALMVTFFLGGWSVPFFPGVNAWLSAGAWYQGVASVGIFVGKVMVLLLLYIAIRWTLPRFKYTQLMDLGWKRLLPLALCNIAYVAVVGVLTHGGNQ